jgi:hypothetical protein
LAAALNFSNRFNGICDKGILASESSQFTEARSANGTSATAGDGATRVGKLRYHSAPTLAWQGHSDFFHGGNLPIAEKNV